MARLMLHRELLKDLGRLPSKVQKKVYELIGKFEEDNTQASIHLEPLGQARDPKVRSARVGDDYRAIVVAPEQGDTFLLMHVDHHDEAYRWCPNKQFEAHGALGTLQVFDVEEANQAVATQAPPPTAEVVPPPYPLDELDDQDLFHAGVPQALIPAVRAVRSDTAFEQLSDYLPREAAQVLFGVVAGLTLDQALEEMLGGVDETATKPAGPGDFSHLAERTNMDLVLVEGEEQLKAILAEDIEEWRVFLHPYQRKLVQWDVAGPIVFRGGWHGKVAEDGDLSAIWDQVLACEAHANLELDRDFVESELHEVIDPMGIDSEEAYLTTVRSGRPRLGRKQRKALWPAFADVFRELAKRDLLTFEGVVHQARLAVEQGRFPRYRYVLVDELQDFGLEALRLIRALSTVEEGHRNPLCVVGDGHQRLCNKFPVALGRMPHIVACPPPAPLSRHSAKS